MGNYVLTHALRELALLKGDGMPDRPLFYQIALAAPDLEARDFLERIAPRIRGFAERFTVYASDTDKALALSEGANQWRSLGRLNVHSEQVARLPYVDFIDATGFPDDSWFGANHSYYGDMPQIINDMRSVFRGDSASNRGLQTRGSLYLIAPSTGC